MLKLKKLFMGLMAAALVFAGLVSCNNDADDDPGTFTVTVSKIQSVQQKQALLLLL